MPLLSLEDEVRSEIAHVLEGSRPVLFRFSFEEVKAGHRPGWPLAYSFILHELAVFAIVLFAVGEHRADGECRARATRYTEEQVLYNSCAEADRASEAEASGHQVESHSNSARSAGISSARNRFARGAETRDAGECSGRARTVEGAKRASSEEGGESSAATEGRTGGFSRKPRQGSSNAHRAEPYTCSSGAAA